MGITVQTKLCCWHPVVMLCSLPRLQVSTSEKQLELLQAESVKQLQDQTKSFQREMVVASQLRIEVADKGRQLNTLRQMCNDETSRADAANSKRQDMQAAQLVAEAR